MEKKRGENKSEKKKWGKGGGANMRSPKGPFTRGSKRLQRGGLGGRGLTCNDVHCNKGYSYRRDGELGTPSGATKCGTVWQKTIWQRKKRGESAGPRGLENGGRGEGRLGWQNFPRARITSKLIELCGRVTRGKANVVRKTGLGGLWRKRKNRPV